MGIFGYFTGLGSQIMKNWLSYPNHLAQRIFKAHRGQRKDR